MVAAMAVGVVVGADRRELLEVAAGDEHPVPAPVTTSTCAGDASPRRARPASSRMVARAMALRASGRSMVSTVTRAVVVEPDAGRR